eukprot:4753237-Prymnesium_polylepis.1
MLDPVRDGLNATRARPTQQALKARHVEPQQAHPQHVVVRPLHHHTVMHVRVHLEVCQRPVPHQMVGRPAAMDTFCVLPV